MTNYEKLKGMTLEGMTKFISEITTTEVFSSFYCTRICPERIDGKCPYDDIDDVPCASMTMQDDVQAWLEADVEENK